ncbi:carboxypeptidase-like regulatory domain-containing protein [Rhizomicrobium electricum]|uniref:Carboxypeptidase-like regulatory domain-containing protein n=1 Tax=Rhizomicrobium electricum TaxID=480070 RepID=A0ABP3PN74_9PROT|nr:carboxypeptidase-like regulatory domain-containing protein [Rhizomicrobium electricum]NIJ48405.1 hypothetical protein [Rhizomicrobium electricum]
MMSKWMALAAAVTLLSAAQAGQHVISGTVRDFDGHPVPGADVALKSSSFDDLYTAKADAEGRYRITVEDGRYMALESITMPDYGKTRLEAWVWNVPVQADMTIDVRYHRLEIYGVNVFKVQGAGPGLIAYFRPMSLTRAKSKDTKKDPDIAPLPAEMDLAIDVDGVAAKIDTIERVQEYVGPGPVMYSYLVHFSPANAYTKGTHVVRIVGTDKANGDRGEGQYFYTAPEYRK